MAAWRRRQASRARARRPVLYAMATVSLWAVWTLALVLMHPAAVSAADPATPDPVMPAAAAPLAAMLRLRRRRRAAGREAPRSVRRGTTRCGAAAPAKCGARCCCPSTSTSGRTIRPP